MINTPEKMFTTELKSDCSKCLGFCCVALYFSASEGFPSNKDAGKPCINLKKDFSCAVHENLRAKGLKGCTAYDCIGAGQKTAQFTFKGQDWHNDKKCADKMFEAFVVMKQLHEMLWYLSQAYMFNINEEMRNKILLLLNYTEKFTLLDVDSLLKLDVEDHRNKVNVLLKAVSESVHAKVLDKKQCSHSHKSNYFGADLRKTNLKGADLMGAFLIAANLRGTDLSYANLIGADLRDADISGADLSNSMFLTQAQINSAKGDSHTKLPEMITRPSYWVK